MFVCGKCHRVSKAHEKATMVIVTYRVREYEYMRDRERTTSEGREIVREMRVCPECSKLSEADNGGNK